MQSYQYVNVYKSPIQKNLEQSRTDFDAKKKNNLWSNKISFSTEISTSFGKISFSRDLLTKQISHREKRHFFSIF